jgi:TonB family protein
LFRLLEHLVHACRSTAKTGGVISGAGLCILLSTAIAPAQTTSGIPASEAKSGDHPPLVSLYDQGGINVSSVETPNTLELTVRAPEPVFVSVEVDRDQNGQVDRLVDVAYRPQRDGTLCTQFLIDETHSTACGGFVSTAWLKDLKVDDGRRQYTLVLPKKELSFNRPSVKLSLVMWNSTQRQTTFFPPGRFNDTVSIPYWITAPANESVRSALEQTAPATPAPGGGTAGYGLGSGYTQWDHNPPAGVYKPGGNVANPILKYAVDPHYSEQARRAKYQGVCVIALIVDAQGNPQNARVVRPLGMGLDEEALKAVRKYKFKPALMDGKTPVPVEINMEVNFRIY